MKTEYKTSTLGWKRERERKEERKRKGGGERKGRKRSSTEGEEKRHEFHRHDDILSDSMWIGPANEIVLVVLIAYANRRPLICRKTSESPDSVGAPLVSCKFLRKVRKNQLGWLVGWLFVTWLLFSWTKPHVRNQDEPGVQTLHVLRSGILKRTRLVCSRAATVETWDNRIVSAVASIRLVPLSPRKEDAWKTHGKKISSPIFESIEHNLDKEERNIIRFFSLLTEID